MANWRAAGQSPSMQMRPASSSTTRSLSSREPLDPQLQLWGAGRIPNCTAGRLQCAKEAGLAAACAAHEADLEQPQQRDKSVARDTEHESSRTGRVHMLKQTLFALHGFALRCPTPLLENPLVIYRQSEHSRNVSQRFTAMQVPWQQSESKL